MDQSPYKCIEQELAYTAGWRDGISGHVTVVNTSRFYSLGWSDAEFRKVTDPHTLHPLWPMIDPRPAASGE